MRRFLLLMALLVVLFSCASGPEPEEEAETVEAVAPDVDEDREEAEEAPTPEPEAEEEAEPEAEEEAEPVEEPEPEPPEPVTLQLINPVDPTRVTRSTFLLSVVPSEGRLASIEVELVSGPVAPDPDGRPFDLVDLESLPAEQRTYEIPLVRDPLLVSVPEGFVDGATYELRVRGRLADERVTEWASLAPRLALGLEPPRLGAPDATIDTTPELTLDTDGPTEVVIAGERSFVVAAGGDIEVPFALNAGRYRVQARTRSSAGYISALGDAVTLRVLADAQPAPQWPVGGEETLTARVGLHWGSVNGAVAYQSRFRSTESDEWQQMNPVDIRFVPMPNRLPSGSSYEWQVRTRNEAGTWFSWSPTERFTVGSFELDFVPVIRSGGTASFSRGYPEGSRDERPVREIELTTPFEMAVNPLTNAELVAITRYAAERGFVEIDAEGIWSAEEDRRPLLGLGVMDYGEQFGLRYREGRLEPMPGYETHPAVGITWHGAVAVANLLSYVEGLSPAHGASGELRARYDAGYRLPTEAEWAYAARGTTDRIFPWGGSLSGTVANYYRSFDPFEDVNEPFTGRGGPTNPVGFFDGSVRDGFQTASDASPFGIRDLVGNVWEWCYDRYDPGYYAESPTTDPLGPDATDFEAGNEAIVLAVALDPNQRVVRGSAWNTRDPDVRLTNRGRYSEQGRSYSIGVRLVRSRAE